MEILYYDNGALGNNGDIMVADYLTKKLKMKEAFCCDESCDYQPKYVFGPFCST